MVSQETMNHAVKALEEARKEAEAIVNPKPEAPAQKQMTRLLTLLKGSKWASTVASAVLCLHQDTPLHSC